MTLQQLDEALKAWKSRLSAIAENLLELQTDLTYQSLTGTGGLAKAEITGATAARCEPALYTVHDLFCQFGLLQATVDRAEAIRKDLPSYFGVDTRLQEAHQLLFDRSIEVEADDVPLTARRLDGEARLRLRLTPEELFTRMTTTFSALRDTVASVGASWAACAGHLQVLEAETERVRAQTALPSHLLAPALEKSTQLLETAREQMRRDPLGASDYLRRQAEPSVARLHQRILRASQVRAEVCGAEAIWRDLEGLHTRAREASEQADHNFGPPLSKQTLVDAAQLAGLSAWLRRLERHAAEGAIEPVAIGLKHWKTAADKCRAQDSAVFTRCSAALSAAEELRGRMGALAAKARKQDPGDSANLREVQRAAEALLQSQPLDLGRAGRAVAAFEATLRGHSPRLPSEAGVPTL